MLRAWQGDPGTGPAWAWGDRGTPHLVPLAQPHSPLHGDTGCAGALVPGLSPPGVGTAAWGCAVPRGRVRPPRARLCHALPCKSRALPRRAGLCRALPRRAGRVGGWSMARCHSGKYFAGATAAGPRPPAAVGAPGDPGAGASSRLPLPRSSSEAASSAPTPPTPPRPRPLARTPHEGMGTTALAAGDPAVPLHGDPPAVLPQRGQEMCPRCPGPSWQDHGRVRHMQRRAAVPGLEAVPGRGWGGQASVFPGGNFGFGGIFHRENRREPGQSQGSWAQSRTRHGPLPLAHPGILGLRLVAAGKPWHTGDGMCPHRCPPAISPGGSRPCLSGGTEQPRGSSRYPPKGESGRAPAPPPACGSAGKLRHKGWGLTWRHLFPSLSRPVPTGHRCQGTPPWQGRG